MKKFPRERERDPHNFTTKSKRISKVCRKIQILYETKNKKISYLKGGGREEMISYESRYPNRTYRIKITPYRTVNFATTLYLATTLTNRTDVGFVHFTHFLSSCILCVSSIYKVHRILHEFYSVDGVLRHIFTLAGSDSH